MRGKQPNAGDPPRAPSAAQRQGTAAFTQVMKAWEELSDHERLTWNVVGQGRRTRGINYFKSVNLRRLRLGKELARLPPPSQPYDGKPVLKGLEIRNRGGRITLKLKLFRKPAVPRTVWGARPCNRGLAKPDKCPRLGWLPAPKGGVCEITRPYFEKHGEYLRNHRVQLVGKRIFIRIRQEMDDGTHLYEEVSAIVPAPEW